MKTPPADLAERLIAESESVLGADPPPRLEDVATAIGASRASLYYYFSGRDDLVAFLLASHARAGAAAVAAAVDPEAAPKDRLRRSVEALTEFLARHPGLCSGMLAAMGSAGRLAEALAVNEAAIAGPLRELIAAGVAAGEVVAPDPVDAANAVLGALLLGVLGRAMQGQDPADVAVRQRLVAQVLRGVGIEP
jgi:AcrR family transcriptional regulator